MFLKYTLLLHSHDLMYQGVLFMQMTITPRELDTSNQVMTHSSGSGDREAIYILYDGKRMGQNEKSPISPFFSSLKKDKPESLTCFLPLIYMERCYFIIYNAHLYMCMHMCVCTCI